QSLSKQAADIAEFTARGTFATLSVRNKQFGEFAAMATEIITSRDNKWLKSFRAALQGIGPKEGDPLAIEGRKLVEDALASGLETRALLVSQ
ncbi:hypothetical protein RSW37_24225, partial [Escherichia coli]|uniref:hypothetical protein n=1 Tax=Escherichia coli TaxID=562 RepID=UPI0028DE5057